MGVDKPRIIGIIGTIVFHVLILVISLCFFIEHSPQQQPEWPPCDSSEILFGGEYVMLGDIAQPLAKANEKPAPSKNELDSREANDLNDSGSKGESSQVTSSTKESTMKVVENTPQKQGPTQEELEAQERARIQEETKQQIQNQIKNQFANKNNGQKPSDGGNAGQQDGNSETGVISGAPGVSSGLTLSNWVKTTSTKSGSVVIAVTVNPQGKVTKATFQSGTGAAGADTQIRSRCEQASLKCSFSVKKGETKDQRGTITWRFK